MRGVAQKSRGIYSSPYSELYFSHFLYQLVNSKAKNNSWKLIFSWLRLGGSEMLIWSCYYGCLFSNMWMCILFLKCCCSLFYFSLGRVARTVIFGGLIPAANPPLSLLLWPLILWFLEGQPLLVLCWAAIFVWQRWTLFSLSLALLSPSLEFRVMSSCAPFLCLFLIYFHRFFYF